MVYMKTLPIILIAVLALAIGIYYFTANRQTNQAQIAITWTTYINTQYGFTIKYPSVYSIYELPEPIMTKISRFKYLSIVDPKDTSTYEPHVVPAAVAIIKQPMVFDGKVYHNLEEYIQAGFAQGPPKGELVSVNGINALHFHYRAASMQEDAPFERYVIIRNDVIYQIDLKTDDPFRDEFLHSFNLIEASGAMNSGAKARARDESWTGKTR